MNFPEKWKETIDIYSINFKNIKIVDILGYPHAANQVFAVRAICNNKEGIFIIKYKGHIESNIRNEVEVLSKINIKFIPEVVEYDDEYTYRVTEALVGEKMSTIIGENTNLESLKYMYKFGLTLSSIHNIKGNFNDAPHRRFEDLLDEEYFKELNLLYVYTFLKNNKPNVVNKCFIHGDFHYANVLWKDNNITGILDFELAGIGNKEFDIAWALILRPGQKFMRTSKELEEFLNGYKVNNTCDERYVKYYMALIYSRFIKYGDLEYSSFIRTWYANNIKNT